MTAQQLQFKKFLPSTSLLHINHQRQQQRSYILETIGNGPLFDNSAVINEGPLRAAIDSLVPHTFIDEGDVEREKLLDDMESMISTTKAFTRTANATVTCRLALLEGVRCPKWHCDYVKYRLIKTYYGEGTEFVDPSDAAVRVTNQVRAFFDVDLYVDPIKIQRAKVGDVLVISGKLREEDAPFPPAVLHRSPLVSEDSLRLLLTVTVS